MAPNIHGVLTDDGRIFHRPGFQYDWAEEAAGATMENGQMTVELRTADGQRMRLSIQPVGPGILRLRAWQGRPEFDRTSEMLAGPLPEPPGAHFKETEKGWSMESGGARFYVNRSPFYAALLDAEGGQLWRLENEEWAAGGLVTPPLGFRTCQEGRHPLLSWRIHNDDRLFGMGEKWNKVEKTGTRATIWTADTCGLNTTDLSYKSVPVLFSSRGWGMMLHSTFRSYWEIGNFTYTVGSFLTEDDKIDLFLFVGRDLKELLGLYSGLTGRAQMPPKWAFGAWMSRCAYESWDEVRTVTKTLRRKRIPCDVIHLDPPWMKTHWYPIYGVDACDFDWNEEDFPDRETIFRELNEDHLAGCLWINPYLPEGTDIYEEAKEKGYLVRSPGGGVSRVEGDSPVGALDFTNPEARAWWQDHLRELLRAGARVFKPDYGERIPESTVFHDGRTGAEMHNLYLLLYNRAVFKATVEESGEPIIWGRSGYIGSQRFAGTWAGDTQVQWRAMKCCMRGGLSAGLTGIAFWSHDIGGFTGPKPSPELYVRWAQWGLLSPFARFHGTTPREPWEYGEEAEEIVAHYLKLRYRLVPYLLTAAEETVRTGVPIMRHMALEFPEEPNVHTLDDQYMLGRDLLVAPVTMEGCRAREVYLPGGTWTDLERPSKTYEGPGFVKLNAPLSRVPVLVREGAAIPQLPGRPQHLKGGPAEALTVDVYPGPRRRAVTFKDEGMRVRLSAASNDREVALMMKAVPVRVNARFLRVNAGGVESDVPDLQWHVASHGTEMTFDASEGAQVIVQPSEES